MYDVTVIGGGVVGAAAAYNLSKLDLKVCLLERGADLSEGASKANSGIIHAGYDCPHGTLKARFNRAGNPLIYKLARELGVRHKNTGSLVLGGAGERGGIEELYERGAANGVEGLKILTRAEILELEPNIAPDVEYALYAATAGIVSPYALCIALAEYAAGNGCDIILNSCVTAIKYEKYRFIISCADKRYESKVIINAAGAYASDVNAQAGEETFVTEFRRGDYLLLDVSEKNFVRRPCFQLPGKAGKGVLLTPTADGNILAGPTAVKVSAPDDTEVERASLEYIKKKISGSFAGVRFDKTIRAFAGVRAVIGEDFIVKNGRNKDFIYAAGICSPGLTSAPAIADYITEELLKNTSLKLKAKAPAVLKPRRKSPDLADMNKREINELIARDPRYGNIICRCEKITEGEIVTAVHAPVPAATLDAVKRRVRAGMGRCQGGFCTPEVIKILARETGRPITEITKFGAGSEVCRSE